MTHSYYYVRGNKSLIGLSVGKNGRSGQGVLHPIEAANLVQIGKKGIQKMHGVPKRSAVMLVLLLFLIGSIFAGCAPKAKPADDQGKDTGKTEDKVIKLGAAVSLSGHLSGEGSAVKRGYELWRDYVNDELGGIQVGNEKYKVEFVFYDDTSDTDTGTKLVEKLIVEDKVDFVMGPYGSTMTFAMSAISERYGKIMMAPASSAGSVFGRGFKYLFGTIQPPSAYPVAYDEVMQRLNPVPKTIAIISPDEAFPLDTAEVTRKGLEEKGYQIVAFEKFPPGTKDLSPIITRFKQLAPDAIFSTTYVDEAMLFLRQAKELDFNVDLWIMTGPPNNKDFRDAMGADAEYLLGFVNWAGDMGWKGKVFGSSNRLAELFEQRFGFKPMYYDASSAGASIALQHAIEKAGSLDTEKVREALMTFTVDNPIETEWGYIGFDETGLNYAAVPGVLQIQDGKVVLIGPSRAAQAEPRYPAPSWSQR